MQLIIRILLGLFTIFIGYNIPQRLNYYEESIIYIPEILILIPGVIALYLDYVNFRASQRIYQFITSFAWLVIYTIMGYYYFDNHLTDKAATIFTVASSDNEREFEFKQGNRLIITNSYRFGRDIYYCRYQKYGDTLTVKNIPASADATQFPTTGIIRHDTMFWNNGDTMLVNK